MSHADFVHLRVHTTFSLSEGALKIDDLVALCRDHRMPAVAITDTANLFGAMQFSNACCAGGVQPIIGCLLPLRREDGGKHNGHAPPPDWLVVLAADETGYGNLVKLSSHAFLGADGVIWAAMPTA